jgi:hypothetical protein
MFQRLDGKDHGLGVCSMDFDLQKTNKGKSRGQKA